MCSQHSHKLVHLCSKAPSLPLPKKFRQCLVFSITKKVLHPWRSADIRFIEECLPIEPDTLWSSHNTWEVAKKYLLDIQKDYSCNLRWYFCRLAVPDWLMECGTILFDTRSNTRKTLMTRKIPSDTNRFSGFPTFMFWKGNPLAPLLVVVFGNHCFDFVKAMQLGRKEWSLSGFHGDRSPGATPGWLKTRVGWDADR